MTFDDGPNAMTEKHIEFFKKKDVKVTFFFMANRAYKENTLKIMKKVLTEGHQIGNHNYFHTSISKDLENSNSDKISQYFLKSTKSFYEKLGIAPKYFRPPFGDIDSRLAKILTEMGFKIPMWNIDSNDWYWNAKGRDKLNIVKSFKD